jgi:hypothetical protein
MSRTRLLLAAVIALGGAVLAVAPLASADRPIRVSLPASDSVGEFCEGFQVLVHPTQNNEFITIFSSGAALITGALKLEVTNLDTGETITLNVPGPARITEDGSALIATGPWLLFGEVGDLGPGSPAQVILITGSFVLNFDEQGNLTAITEVKGQTTDICAALAA